VEALHDVLRSQLPLDDIRVCYHDDPDGCECRKPAPGLLVAAAQAAHLDLGASFMVGDRWRDVAAGQRAGCQSIFIDYNYAEPQPHAPYLRAQSLHEAADLILCQQHLVAH
jgi:D-glycero-D-manno-heptose 1,7-bisphosphate phosphatase